MTQPLGTPIDRSNVRPQPDIGKPSLAKTARLIEEELRQLGIRCSGWQAGTMVTVLDTAVSLTRKSRNHHYLSDATLELAPYLEHIMPVGVDTPEPGSAHDALQRLLLHRGEKALVLTFEGPRTYALTIQRHDDA